MTSMARTEISPWRGVNGDGVSGFLSLQAALVVQPGADEGVVVGLRLGAVIAAKVVIRAVQPGDCPLGAVKRRLGKVVRPSSVAAPRVQFSAQY